MVDITKIGFVAGLILGCISTAQAGAIEKGVTFTPSLGMQFKNISFEQQFPKKIQISRLVDYTEPKDIDVTFKNLTIAGKKINFLDPEYFNLSKCNGTIQFD